MDEKDAPIESGGGGTAVESSPEPTPAQSSTPEASAEIDADGRARTSEPQKPESGAPAKKPLPGGIKPKGSRFNDRISDLVQQRRERDARIEQLVAENQSLRGGQPAGGGQPGQRGDGLTGGDATKLSPEQFETYGDYVQALVQQTIDSSFQKHRSRESHETLQNYRAERMTSFEAACEPLRSEYGEDFDAAITDPTLPVTDVMADAILECENGPDVMLFLAANRNEAAKIAGLNPRAATVAIGRIAAKIAASQGNVPQQSGGTGAQPVPGTPAAAAPARPAPSPVPQVRGGTPQANAIPKDHMSTNEWLDAERARLRNKFGPRYRGY